MTNAVVGLGPLLIHELYGAVVQLPAPVDLLPHSLQLSGNLAARHRRPGGSLRLRLQPFLVHGQQNGHGPPVVGDQLLGPVLPHLAQNLRRPVVDQQRQMRPMIAEQTLPLALGVEPQNRTVLRVTLEIGVEVLNQGLYQDTLHNLPFTSCPSFKRIR